MKHIDYIGNKQKRKSRKKYEGGYLIIYSGAPQEKIAAAGVACLIHEKYTEQVQK